MSGTKTFRLLFLAVAAVAVVPAAFGAALFVKAVGEGYHFVSPVRVAVFAILPFALVLAAAASLVALRRTRGLPAVYAAAVVVALYGGEAFVGYRASHVGLATSPVADATAAPVGGDRRLEVDHSGPRAQETKRCDRVQVRAAVVVEVGIEVECPRIHPC